MKIALGFAMLSIAACSSSSSGGATSTPAGTVTLDLSPYPMLANSSIAFSPDVAETSRVIAAESDRFREVYNRLLCRAASEPVDADYLHQAFARFDLELAAVRPVRVESVSVTLSDDANLADTPALGACIAYRTKDGQWHGELVAVDGAHDPEAHETRTTLEVHADDVDAIGIMFAEPYVKLREVS